MKAIHLFLGKIVLYLDAFLGAILAVIFSRELWYQEHGEIPESGPISGVQFMRLHREGPPYSMQYPPPEIMRRLEYLEGGRPRR